MDEADKMVSKYIHLFALLHMVNPEKTMPMHLRSLTLLFLRFLATGNILNFNLKEVSPYDCVLTFFLLRSCHTVFPDHNDHLLLVF